MDGKFLGKIESVRLGNGGYQDAMFGLSLEFKFDKSYGIGTFKGAWGLGIDCKNTHWTEVDRDREFAATMRLMAQTMQDAKVDELAELKGVPVEVTIERGSLKSWRVLTEVL